MNSIKIFVVAFFIICSVFTYFSACDQNDETGNNTSDVKPAIITFFNASGYYVDLYINSNPLHYDITTLVHTFYPAETKPIELYPSYDQLLGDAFYPQYRIRLADLLQTGTVDIFVPTQLTNTNLTFVIKEGDRITRTIPNPTNVKDLKFYHAYLIVKNNSRTPIQIRRGNAILIKMDNGAAILNPDDIGFYEIEFTAFDTVINMTQMSVFSSEDIAFPSFTVEKGKKYSFTFGDVISDPKVENILN